MDDVEIVCASKLMVKWEQGLECRLQCNCQGKAR